MFNHKPVFKIFLTRIYMIRAFQVKKRSQHIADMESTYKNMFASYEQNVLDLENLKKSFCLRFM